MDFFAINRESELQDDPSGNVKAIPVEPATNTPKEEDIAPSSVVKNKDMEVIFDEMFITHE